MKWFIDMHHASLAHSIRLMAKRLGAEVYFPIGLEWADFGYWLINKPYGFSMDTARQYLSLDQRYKPMDGTLPLNKIASRKPTHFEIKDLAHGDILKSITLDQFKQMDIDVVIASIPDHVESFARLIREHKPKAKLVFQVGNIMWNDVAHTLLDNKKVLNLMASTSKFAIPSGINYVFYHQEIPLRPYKEPPIKPTIKSFVHLLPKKEVYFKYKEALPEVEFKAYGAQAPDGYCNGVKQVYDEIQDSSMVFNVKPYGDGFGHIWHNAFMLGRPVITNFSDYKDKLGGLLFEDLQTGIDFEKRSFEENVNLIRLILNDRKLLLEMSLNCFTKFREVVNYDKEEQELRKFFERLI